MTDSFETNGMSFKLDRENFTAELLSASGPVVIPKSIFIDSTEFIITDIHEKALKYATSLEFSPDSQIKSLKDDMFFYNTRIQKITIPKSIEIIDRKIFKQYLTSKEIIISPENKHFSFIDNKFICTKSDPNIDNFDSLLLIITEDEEIVIPPYFRQLCRDSFKNRQFTKITFAPNSQLSLIEECVFSYQRIETIEIPSQVKIIKDGAFANCNHLKKVTFQPNSKLEVIGNMVFCKCRNLETISLPSSVKIIGRSAFGGNKKLKITFPPDSNIEFIDECAFADCIIESFTVPSHLEKISNSCFNGCKDLKTVIFPENSHIQLIDDYAFGHTSIESITIPSSVTKIGNRCFGSCINLTTVKFMENSQCQLICEDAFCSSGLVSIDIPAQCKLEDRCFIDCKNLRNFNVSPDNQNYKFVDNKFLITKSNPETEGYDKLVFAINDQPTLVIPSFIKALSIECLGQSKFTAVEFSNDAQIESIEKLAFHSSEIETIKLPSCVKKIGKDAFSNCTNLKNVIFEPNSKLQIIDENAFLMSSIESIIIPSKVTEIRKSAFSICSSLTNVTFEPNSKLKLIDESAFSCTKFDTINLPPQLETIGDYAFQRSKIVDLKIPSKVKSIGKECFKCCDKLHTVVFSSDSQIKVIERGMFTESSLQMISIPSSVTSIEERAFYQCKNIEIIRISEDSRINYLNDPFRSCAKSLKKIISPMKYVKDILMSIHHIVDDKDLDNFPDKLYLEIPDDVVNLDEISDCIGYVDEICLPNAEQVSLNAVCNFTVLYVPRQAVLNGTKIIDPDRRIIFYKRNSIAIDVMTSEEFTVLYQSRKNIDYGVTSNVYKIPNPNVPKMSYALKVYKCRMPVNNNNNDDEHNEEEWENNEEDNNDSNNNNDDLIDISKMSYFFGEYEILNCINHQNIIKAYSFFFGTKQYPPAILLEYCGHNLAKSIRLLGKIECISVIYEIASAMQSVHRFNIIHRDLKPENILLDIKKHVKICDFGISTIIDVESQRRTRTRTHGIGSLDYMAPELYDDTKKYNEKVDVYAFGIIMLFILTKGNPPAINIANVINAREIPIPNSINELSTQLIRKCTSYDYNDRPSFTEIVQLIVNNNYKLIDDLTENQITSIINHLNYNE